MNDSSLSLMRKILGTAPYGQTERYRRHFPFPGRLCGSSGDTTWRRSCSAMAQVRFLSGDLCRKTGSHAFWRRRSHPFFHTCANNYPHLRQQLSAIVSSTLDTFAARKALLRKPISNSAACRVTEKGLRCFRARSVFDRQTLPSKLTLQTSAWHIGRAGSVP